MVNTCTIAPALAIANNFKNCPQTTDRKKKTQNKTSINKRTHKHSYSAELAKGKEIIAQIKMPFTPCKDYYDLYQMARNIDNS